jgi:hypothetical protein
MIAKIKLSFVVSHFEQSNHSQIPVLGHRWFGTPTRQFAPNFNINLQREYEI